MNRSYKLWALSGLLAAAMAGCGGGGGSGSTSGGGSTPGLTISGVAATGAAFTGATVSVIDSRGVTVGSGAAVQADGSYSITLASGAVAPFVLIASRTDANGDTQQLVSVLASATDTVANITPITSLIASRLSPSGDPAKLAEELAAGDATITSQAVADVVTEVQTILDELLTATGTESVNPLTGTFDTDGTGYDRLLDSISISFLPASDSDTNIEIVVKQELADGAQPEAVTFNSGDTTPPALPAIDPATLVAEGTSAKIATFLSELTACYALQVDQRVTATVDADQSNNRVGDAADVTATACRAVFSGNDPANFLSAGAVVERTENNLGAFASLFRGGATGLVFSQGSYEFTRSNGDVVAGYKSRDTAGNETYDTFVLRDDGDGKLRLIGNQYQYGGRVTAYQQRRNFITLNQSTADYFSTGYVIDVPNTQSAGNPIFDRVIVTTPNGNRLVLRPLGGVSFLGIARGDDPDTVGNEGTITSTNFIRLRSEFVGTGPGGTPSTVDTATLVFANPERTEDQLANTPSQGTWRYDYYLAGNATTTPDTTQYFKNRARALTIGELRTRGLAELSTALKSEISTGADATGRLIWSVNEIAEVGNVGQPGWTVASGQLPPTQITLFGSASGGARYTDTATVASSARFGTVACSRQGGSDTHCHDNGNGTFGPGFAAGGALDGLHLFARDASGREYANFYALYNLNLAP